MRIGCLQFAPQVGDVDNNLNRADSVLSKANPEDLDILVLPELAFTGYNFKSLQEISSFLEPSGSGITSLWARTVALKYDCYVAVGYPEKVDVSPKWPTSPEYYNSCIVVNSDGETIANYRKSFLYYTDETWALEGNSGFFDGWIPGLGNTSMGICMDLNPYKFEAPWHAFEFACHVLKVKSNLVIVSMAWITREDSRRFSRKPNEPDMDSLTYWVTRLEPLIRSESHDEIIVVFCNRTGNEDEVTYCGTSAVIGIQDGEVKVYGLLGRGEKELLIVDTNTAAFAKLLYRPQIQSEDSDKASDILTHPPNRSQLRAETYKGNIERKDTPTKAEGRENANGRDGGGFGLTATTKLQDKTSSKRSPRPRGRSPARQRPNISITLPPQRGSQGELKSPGQDDFDIPTPSAPSPTPIAIRPKIIIPESRSAKPYECFLSHADSAVSAVSAKSCNSIRSDTSGATFQSVQSNPRPPEDSTPYPHSGMPVDDGFAKVRIYDGHVAITNVESELVPATPVDDSSPSPMTLRWFWRPSDSLIRSPGSGMESHSGQPDEPKQGHALISSQAAFETLDHTLAIGQSHVGEHSSKQGRTGSRSPPPRALSKWAKRSDSLTRTSQAVSEVDPRLNRPSSPKSRNASRSGMDDMRNSAMVHHHHDVMSGTGTPLPGRPESPKSRNCSRSRPTMWLNNDETLSTVLFEASNTPPRSISRMGRPQRSSSFTSLMKGSLVAQNNSGRGAARTASRGRQGGLQVSPTKSDPTSRRARSVDSVQAGAYYSQFRHHASQPQERGAAENRRTLRVNGSMNDHQGQQPSQFERFETAVCPNCPVHGERTTPAQAQTTTDEAPLTTAAATAILRGDRSVEVSSPATGDRQDTSGSDRLRTLVEMAESSLSLSGSHPGNVNRRSAHLFEIGSLLPVTST